MAVQEVLLWSEHSEVHLGTDRDGVLSTPEACNCDDLDPATKEQVALVEAQVIPEFLRARLCERCFPFAGEPLVDVEPDTESPGVEFDGIPD